jgi:enoyl-CoA hydratase/carnithine racemase
MPMSAMTADAGAVVRRSDAEGIAVLTLSRPSSRNALSDRMMAALQAELDALRADRAIKVAILAADGPVFCAGHDLKEMQAARAAPDRGRAHFTATFAACTKLMTSIVRLPQPVIAEVQGVATAAGCQLVASCDLAVASSAARFATPGVAIGLFCSTPMVALSRNVSRKAAMEMLLTGDMVGADEAKALGLVNRVVEPDALRTETLALARQIAERSTLTVKVGKQAFYRQAEMSLDEAYAYTADVMVENMLARDAEEGIGAFIERREPRWEGR